MTDHRQRVRMKAEVRKLGLGLAAQGRRQRIQGDNNANLTTSIPSALVPESASISLDDGNIGVQLTCNSYGDNERQAKDGPFVRRWASTCGKRGQIRAINQYMLYMDIHVTCTKTLAVLCHVHTCVRAKSVSLERREGRGRRVSWF